MAPNRARLEYWVPRHLLEINQEELACVSCLRILWVPLSQCKRSSPYISIITAHWGRVASLCMKFTPFTRVYLEETQRAVQVKVEEDISSIYQMPEINPDITYYEA